MPKYINRFKDRMFTEETIVDEEGEVVGHLRIKPSGILWKPKGSQKYFSVPLKRFAEWITAPETKAGRVKQ